jgi:purine-binding chemotaxis protein CheW
MNEPGGGVSQKSRPGVRQLVAFRVGAERFAIDIARVQEIVKPLPLTVVPHMPEGFSGVIRLRDEVVIVADLHARFNFPAPGEGSEPHIIILAGADRKIGVVVDAVSEVIRLSPAMLGPSPDFHGGVPVAAIEGIARVGDDLVSLLDVDALFPPAGAPAPEHAAPQAEAAPPVAGAPNPGAEAAPATPETPNAPDAAPEGLYREIGELARYINMAHRTLAAGMAGSEAPSISPMMVASARLRDLPTANDVLHHVTQETEIATMQVLANTEETSGGVAHLEALLGDLEQAVPAASEARARTCDLAERMRTELEHLRAVQNDTLMALSFQDLTGQKIKQVIALMGEVEERILELVVGYGMAGADQAAAAAEPRGVQQRIQDLKGQADGGPLRQDRVDGLLAEFGF